MRMYGLGRTSGGYIKKDIEAWLAADLNWETMDEEEAELYLKLLKKSISGTLGKNLLDIEFSTKQVEDSDEHRLYRLSGSPS